LGSGGSSWTARIQGLRCEKWHSFSERWRSLTTARGSSANQLKFVWSWTGCLYQKRKDEFERKAKYKLREKIEAKYNIFSDLGEIAENLKHASREDK